MSNNSYYKAFFPMGMKDDFGKQKLEEMEIEVYYTLGGANYFSGGITRRGVYVSFTPVIRDKLSTTRTLYDDRGRKMLLQETKRRDDKAGRLWAGKIEARAQALAWVAIAQNWQQAAQIVAAPDYVPPANANPTPRGWDKVEGGTTA